MFYVIVLITYIICREKFFERLFTHLIVVIDKGDKCREARHVYDISSCVWEGSDISFVFVTFCRTIRLMLLCLFDSQRSIVTKIMISFVTVVAFDLIIKNRWVFIILVSHIGIFIIVRCIRGIFTFFVVAAFTFVFDLIVATLWDCVVSTSFNEGVAKLTYKSCRGHCLMLYRCYRYVLIVVGNLMI